MWLITVPDTVYEQFVDTDLLYLAGNILDTGKIAS